MPATSSTSTASGSSTHSQSTMPRPGILSPKFYTLIGALESAHYFIDNYFRKTGNTGILGSVQSMGRENAQTGALGLNSENHDATKDEHLNPTPDKTAVAFNNLRTIKIALLDAECELGIALFRALQKQGVAQKLARSAAWKAFTEVLTTQTFIFATSIRELIWVPKSAQEPNIGTGAPEWAIMEGRLQRILKSFAEVSRGGGGDEGLASDWSSIITSNDGSISF